ncbi:MAG: methyltransferase domain-containing protein [Planctomycetaceae bacterium]|nr:methyltransferase domain-containing protein [Planctomycetaceae bacterium]
MPELLACPDCAGPLKSEGLRLRCGCAAWPVVADIPVLLPWARNRDVRVEEALARFLPPADGLWSKILRRLLPGTGAVEKAIADRDATFIDLAAALGRTSDLDYFRYRFSDLSYVSTAALLTPLQRGPVLDLGCGAGHLAEALFRRIPRSVVVGVDFNFTLLYLARRFVAPSALFVCADGSGRLPFLDGVFEAALCADAFNYLPDRRRAAKELLRVTRGPLLLSRLADPAFRGKGAFEPLEPAAYIDLFAARSPQLFRDGDLLRAFLKTRTLDLSQPGGGRDDVLTLVAGVNPAVYSGADYFVRGDRLNPIYDVTEDGERLQLNRRFVSENFSKSYARADGVLPERLTVTREQIASRDPELVRQFVLLDLPPNYC